MADTLLKSVYKKQALVPPSPWLDNQPPAKPVVTTSLQNETWKITWTHPEEKDVFHWVVYYQYGTTWNYQVLNRNDRWLTLNRIKESGTTRQTLKAIIVSAVDRTGNESDRKLVEIK